MASYGFYGTARIVTLNTASVVAPDPADTKTTTAYQFHVRRSGNETTLLDSPEIFIGFYGDI
jgi:hypothetical protein